ncbi:MAG: hypothetical protein SGJ19_06835 [Planctomycetia bacterium]|nr:hypothetical protein [Planctomycetia bacterium]
MSTVDPQSGPPRRPNFDGFLEHGPARPARAGRFVQNALVVVGLALVARVGWSVWQVVEDRFPAEPRERLTADSERDYGNVPSVAPLADAPAEPPDTSYLIDDFDPFAAPATPVGRLDWAKAQQRELLQSSAALGRRLSEWREEDRQWLAEVVPLLDNQAGKSLAANPDRVKSFRAIYEKVRPEVSRATELEEIARELTRGAEAALADVDDAYLPEKEAVNRLTLLMREAWEAASSYREGRGNIAALVVESRDQPVGDQTLRAAITEDQHAERLAAIEFERERIESAQKAADAQIAEAKEQVIRQAGEAEAVRILAGLEAAQAQRALVQARYEREQAQQQRAAALEKDLAEVKRTLVPFVTKGYAQPGPGMDVQTTDLAPMSLSKMVGNGALKPTREGMEALLAIANWGNDRDRGPFPATVANIINWREVDIAFIKRAQELLILHGDAMVEAGLLSP